MAGGQGPVFLLDMPRPVGLDDLGAVVAGDGDCRVRRSRINNDHLRRLQRLEAIEQPRQVRFLVLGDDGDGQG
jgi:hypothetical protein